MKIRIGMVLLSSLLFSNTSFAGEKMPAGTVLRQESMVFTIDEAKRMATYIDKLEKESAKNEQLLQLKNELIENKNDQIISFQDYQDLQKKQIEKYLEIQELDQKRISSLERQTKVRKLETAGAFAGGVVVAVTLLIVADQLDDKILESGVSTNNIGKAITPGITASF